MSEYCRDRLEESGGYSSRQHAFPHIVRTLAEYREPLSGARTYYAPMTTGASLRSGGHLFFAQGLFGSQCLTHLLPATPSSHCLGISESFYCAKLRDEDQLRRSGRRGNKPETLVRRARVRLVRDLSTSKSGVRSVPRTNRKAQRHVQPE